MTQLPCSHSEMVAQVTAEGVGRFAPQIGFDAPNGHVHQGQAAGRRVRLLPVDRNITNPPAVLGDEYPDSENILVVCATGTKTTDHPDCSIDVSKRASI